MVDPKATLFKCKEGFKFIIASTNTTRNTWNYLIIYKFKLAFYCCLRNFDYLQNLQYAEKSKFNLGAISCRIEYFQL